MSGIRLATLHDLNNIRTLILQLEYTIAESVLENTLTLLLAHHFYQQCGYEESPKYFVKHL
jgi:hypothetical protein